MGSKEKVESQDRNDRNYIERERDWPIERVKVCIGNLVQNKMEIT